MYKYILKPLIDWCFALFLIVLLFPVLLFISLVLLFYNHGNVFFLQKRSGKCGKNFILIKFRTMKELKDEAGHMLPDSDRQSGFGNFLRHYHFDEFPQLINILFGQLSFIGPRPLLPEYIPHYNKSERSRLDTKPGITGLVQVLGGNSLDWGKRMRLDAFYVRNESCMLDCKILLLTARYFYRKKSFLKNEALFSNETFIAYARRRESTGK